MHGALKSHDLISRLTGMKASCCVVSQEVLSNVAVLNKAGPNKDLWEVKKEFKHNRS